MDFSTLGGIGGLGSMIKYSNIWIYLYLINRYVGIESIVKSIFYILLK